MKKKVLRERNKVTVEVVQAVAIAIAEEAEENNKTVEKVVSEILEEAKPRGRKKKEVK